MLHVAARRARGDGCESWGGDGHLRDGPEPKGPQSTQRGEGSVALELTQPAPTEHLVKRAA